MNTNTTPNRTLAKRTFWLCAVAFTLSACAVGPDFQQPTANAPANWNEWHNGSGLQLPQAIVSLLAADVLGKGRLRKTGRFRALLALAALQRVGSRFGRPLVPPLTATPGRGAA